MTTNVLSGNGANSNAIGHQAVDALAGRPQDMVNVITR